MLVYSKDVEIENMLALCYMNTKKYEQAIEIFENLKKEFPKNHILITNLAQCYLKLGDIEYAKKNANEALLIFPEYSDAIKIIKKVEKDEQ